MNDRQNESSVIDPVYLPFTAEQLGRHFLEDKDGRVAYYQGSAERYKKFRVKRQDPLGIPITEARYPCQIQKDERFWTAASLKQLVDSPDVAGALEDVLRRAFGARPPIPAFSDWGSCLEGDLRLVLEPSLRSPRLYVNWLKENLAGRHLIPYVLGAAQRPSLKPLEGSTQVDALIINVHNGFSVLVEAKVLSDISCTVSFDAFRNQLTRNLDVLLEQGYGKEPVLNARRAERSLFALLTPRCFQERPYSRFYGRLFYEYKFSPSAIARDLPHRSLTQGDSEDLSRRIGWITFEDISEAVPGACPWLKGSALPSFPQSHAPTASYV